MTEPPPPGPEGDALRSDLDPCFETLFGSEILPLGMKALLPRGASSSRRGASDPERSKILTAVPTSDWGPGLGGDDVRAAFVDAWIAHRKGALDEAHRGFAGVAERLVELFDVERSGPGPWPGWNAAKRIVDEWMLLLEKDGRGKELLSWAERFRDLIGRRGPLGSSCAAGSQVEKQDPPDPLKPRCCAVKSRRLRNFVPLWPMKAGGSATEAGPSSFACWPRT